MMHRYFLIEPCYSDGDTFCSFTVGSGRVRANIQIYANESMLADVAWALTAPNLQIEHPQHEKADITWFTFQMSVIPTNDERRIVRFRVCQGMLDDGAPFTTDIQFWVSMKEAGELSSELTSWLKRKDYTLDWKP